tara:strand:+ start:3226 stop:3744 length:519 start_codon:yes stop_codon:yes gene_type:complete
MKKLITVFTFLVLQINFAIANTNVAFIDLDKVLKVSKAGSSILKNLSAVNNNILKNFKEDEKNFKVKETKLIAQKNILSEDEFQLNVNKLKTEINNYNVDRKKIINDFNKLKIDNTNKFLQKIKILLAKYSDEKSISLILPKKNLIIGKTELDITDEIIKIINADINNFKIK